MGALARCQSLRSRFLQAQNCLHRTVFTLHQPGLPIAMGFLVCRYSERVKKSLFCGPPDSSVELIGEDVMIYLSETSETLRLSGATAEAFLAIHTGERVDPSDVAVRELLAAGVVRPRGISRRGLVKAGAVGVGAGVAVLAFPDWPRRQVPLRFQAIGTPTRAAQYSGSFREKVELPAGLRARSKPLRPQSRSIN